MGKRRPTSIVGYLRTSTEDQLLGIEAQRRRVQDLASEYNCLIDHIYEEHESGGDNGRPELDRAIRHARRLRAFLVVAKLDRLTRDQVFLGRLVDGNVPIIFGDLPDIDFTTPEGRMMLQVFGTFAEFERRRIGARTREALHILKARGVRLGASNPRCRNLGPEARARGVAAAARNRTARAVEEQSDVAAIAAEKRAEGLSLRKIAAHLNEEGYPTRDGCRAATDPETGKPRGGWSAAQVKRVLDRARSA